MGRHGRAKFALRGWVIGCVLGATLVAGGCTGGSNRTEPSTDDISSERALADTTVSSADDPVGTTPAENAPDPNLFTRQQAVLHDSDGGTCDVCLWIADTSAARRTGLMGVTTLGDAAGMAFLFDPPTSGKFWMKDTLIELEIAFFDADRNLVGSEVMTPCPSGSCQLYGPSSSYSTAVEFPLGRLAELGIDELADIEILDTPCDAGLK